MRWSGWLGWLVVTPLVGFVALRTAGFEDRSPAFVALVTLTLWVLLPAWGVLAVAIVVGDRPLAAVAGGVCAAQAVFVGPDLRWWAHPQPAATGEPFTLAAANAYAGNARPDEAIAALVDLDADVLVVTELNPRIAAGLRRAYPHVVHDPSAIGVFGAGIYSRFPLSRGQRILVAGLPTVRASVGGLDVVAVHTPQPLGGVEPLRRQVDEYVAMVRSASRPLVLAGDFNATRQHRTFRALLRSGLRDAHAERGRARVTSWPQEGRIPFRFALLDHVLVSDGLAVLDAGEATVPGSDHRAVTARLALAADRRREGGHVPALGVDDVAVLAPGLHHPRRALGVGQQ